MRHLPRRPLLFMLALLALAAVACGTASLGGNNAETPAETVDDEAIIASAVATIEAQQPEAVAVSAPVAAVDSTIEDQLTDIYANFNLSVVHIIGEGGTGTGFVIDDDGHIVTNNHVLNGGDQFEIVFASAERRTAGVVGTDVDSDLAVIKVTDLPAGVQPVSLGNSNDIEVGQFVVAIGNPFGEESSMSFGIISGLGRSLRSQRVTDGLGFYSLPSVIQTDAPINPGNSGGPLFNLDGEVIGVNSAIRTETGFNSGVGFSIPVNAVKLIAPALIENGTYIYPFLGVQIVSLDLAAQEALDLDDTLGALVRAVTPGQPAAEGGIREGDIIRTMNGTVIENSDALIAYLVFETQVGDEIEVRLIRNGEEQTLTITLGERP